MEDKVLEIISSIINVSVEELKNKIDVENLWDSFSRVEIIIALEEEFDISFSQEEIAEIKTIAQVYSVIRNKI